VKFTTHDGRLYRDGIYTEPEDAERLLSLWRQVETERADYFATNAKALADALETAMREAGIIAQQEAA